MDRPPKSRRIRIIAVAAMVIFALFLPYPTRLSPELHIQIVDPSGRGVPGLSTTWYCSFYAAMQDGTATTDSDGFLHLPVRRVWMSPAARFAQVLLTLLPHSGGFTQRGSSVEIQLPTGMVFQPEQLDDARLSWDSGAGAKWGRMRMWDVIQKEWRVAYTEEMELRSDRLSVGPQSPGESFVSPIRLTVERKETATMPARLP